MVSSRYFEPFLQTLLFLNVEEIMTFCMKDLNTDGGNLNTVNILTFTAG
jgi:hypothetical protein